MNKIFVYSANEPYLNELECAYVAYGQHEIKIHQDNLTIDLLTSNKINVVVSDGLSKQWYMALRGMGIITITFGRHDVFYELSDIVVDYLGSDEREKTFFGVSSSYSSNLNNLEKVFDIIHMLDWDSNFFGFNIAYISCLHLTQSIWMQVSDYIKSNNIRLIEYLCDCHDARSVNIAEKNGFNFVDIRLNFTISTSEFMVYKLSDNIIFSKATKRDIPKLRNIANGIYKDSRYFFDGNFDQDKVNDFYQGWVEKGVLGEFDDECWCLYIEGIACAFSTIKYISKKEAAIGIVGVSEHFRGSGLGNQLMSSIMQLLKGRGINKVNVVTQGRNYAAQNLYQSVGFRIKSTQLWYHKWI